MIKSNTPQRENNSDENKIAEPVSTHPGVKENVLEDKEHNDSWAHAPKTNDTNSTPKDNITHEKLEHTKEESKKQGRRVHREPVANWKWKDVSAYDQLDMIGKGTFGKVFKARLKLPEGSKEISEIVALKKLNMAKEEEGFPITALREIQILKKLKHKNIVNLKDIVVSRRK